ncbi:PREDICTED: mas-related G-protein coupled receptor member X1-like [Chlamydotis macqueenii]|nr:PREDICTED: mas-related G-protein coupled receptor member X1-like [Chlamydotis macqueenii]
MEETNTTELPLNNLTFGYEVYEEAIKNECFRRYYALRVFLGICMAISLCGLVGNGTVVWFLGFHMKQNRFTVYILNLAVADFSLLLLFFLLVLANLSFIAFCPYLYNFFNIYSVFYFVVVFLSHFFDLSSLSLLTAISVERCLSVLFPIWYRCHRPKHLSAIVSGVLWALAGFFVSSMYLTLSFVKSSEFAGVAIAISSILSLMMLISNLCLFVKLRCGSQRRRLGKLYVAVLLNVIFFFAFGIPFGVNVFVNLPSSGQLLPENTYLLLALLNSSINPVIYFLVGSCRQRRFQVSVKVAFRQVFEEKAMSEEGSHVPGDIAVETTV